MKKIIMATVAASFCLFLVVSAAQAQGDIDKAQEGAKLVAASKFMIAQGQILQAAKSPDRAMLLDRGNLLIKNGYNDIENGEFCIQMKAKAICSRLAVNAWKPARRCLKLAEARVP